MAINKIDGIHIDGTNKAFGGYIYSFDMTVGVGPDITKIKIDFVNDTGIFSKPVLSTIQPYSISIGNIFSDDFYAISYEFSKSSSGRILSVEFWDGSIVLDNFWVGLNWRMGNNNFPHPKNLILVGQQFHPCDVNEDGVYDTADIAELEYDALDPCELRCPADSNIIQPIIEECSTKAATEIFAVKYNFKMLLNALSKVGLKVNFPSVTNDFYWGTHTGTVREVLNQWCGEFGWTYVWEKGVVTFLDVSKPPKVNIPQLSNIETLKSGETLEGTFSRGTISHFVEPGILQKQDCNSPQKVLLTCLTLEDLFGTLYNPQSKALSFKQGDEPLPDSSGNVPVPGANPSDGDTYFEYKDDVFKDGVPITNFEESVICSYYGEQIRNLYNFYNYYGITSDVAANALVNKQLNRVGNLTILKVMSESSNGDLYQYLLQQNLQDGSRLFNDADSETFIKNKGYFVLAFFDDKHIEKSFNIEHTLASDFFGQHWIRTIRGPSFGKNPQIIPGGGTYYASLATDARDLPFTAFRPTANSKIGKMVQTFGQKQQNKFKSYGSKQNAQEKWIGQDGPKRLLKSIVYFHKNPIWSPSNELLDYLLPIYKQKVPLLPKVFNLDSSLLVRFLNDSSGNTLVKDEDLLKVKLMAFYPVTFSYKTTVTENPDEEYPHWIEDLKPAALAPYGLLSKTCVSPSIENIKLYTPAGGSIQFENSAQFNWEQRDADPTISATSPHYQIYIVPTDKGRGYIPKLESVYITPAPTPQEGFGQTSISTSAQQILTGSISPNVGSNMGTLKTEYNVQDINRGIIKFINKLVSPGCDIPDALLLKAHQDFNKNLNFSVLTPFVHNEYQIFGVTLENPIRIIDGLESLKVRNDENGVKTNITVGNSRFTPPSPDFLQRKVEFQLRADVRYGRPNPW